MEDFSEILKKLGTGTHLSNTPYDTAWIARLKEIEPSMSNSALEWVCENQLEDGSWGADKPMYYHDRVICTLSSMIALTYRGRRQQDKLRIQKGLAALEAITAGATQGLKADLNGSTVGFEMIAPTLVAEAERIGIITQQKERILGRLSHLRKIKMGKLAGVKVSRFVTIAHSAEMAGKDNLGLLDVENLQEANGSVGNSPSATAYFALEVRPGDEKALNYLRPITASRNGGAPTLSPIEIFETIWVLWNLSLTNLYQQDAEIKALCEPHLDYLEKQWRPKQGLGFSESFTPTDGDDTSVGYEILSKFGRKPDLKSVLQYEEENWFRCFYFEANPSIDVNIHVLGALKQAGYDKAHPSVQKVIKFIRSMRQSGGYWLDKWNVSPYYTTAHLAILAEGYDDEMCQESINWILHNQNSNGSWGFYGMPTAEETAYCLQSLIMWKKSGHKVQQGRIEQATYWLSGHCEPPYPPLWIDKSLYCPEILVKSSIVSALCLAQE